MYTQADIDSLKQSLARGIRQASEGGKTIVYNSPAEMRTTLALMIAEVHGRASQNQKVVFGRGDK